VLFWQIASDVRAIKHPDNSLVDSSFFWFWYTRGNFVVVEICPVHVVRHIPKLCEASAGTSFIRRSSVGSSSTLYYSFIQRNGVRCSSPRRDGFAHCSATLFSCISASPFISGFTGSNNPKLLVFVHFTFSRTIC
jgi:hypothetical protein